MIGIPAEVMCPESQVLSLTRISVLSRFIGEQGGNLSLFKISPGIMALTKSKEEVFHLLRYTCCFCLLPFFFF